MLAWEIARQARHQPRALFGIGHQHLDDVLHGDRVMVGMPAVEVGDHGDRRVADFGLAGELGLGQIGHADHRVPEALIGEALGERRELRALDADIGAAPGNRDIFRLGGRGEVKAQARADGMRHRHMRHAACAEEGVGAMIGAVDELIDQHEGAGRQLFLEGAAGRQRDKVGDPRPLERVNIGAVVDVGGREPVALVVARQEHDGEPVDAAHAERRRGLAPWAFDALLAHVLEARQIVDARTADDPQYRFRHVVPPVPSWVRDAPFGRSSP